ncbi:MAG TPA: hypothetical protein VFT95_06010, partial [Micromonosporaceae bacterium]|nr:hypothetical protein [Micromonosporaceae bacterium]
RIATYRPGRATGDAPGYNVRLFPSAAVGTVRLFGAAVVPSTPGEYGVCVLAGADDRVHCGLVTVTKQAGSTVPRAVLWPLPTDAPLVARDVVAGTFTGEIGPPPGDFGGNCGTCF